VTPAEQRYADALAEAIAASLQRDRVPGDLARVVIRWFEGPDYLTIHGLGTFEEGGVANEDAWYPLEWPNEERETDRVDGVMADEALAGPVEELASELGEDGWPWDEQPRALIAAAQKLRELLDSRGIPTAPHFAVGISHFEGWGCADSVPRANPEAVLDLLAERDLLPGE
jgi:hypothetical protein